MYGATADEESANHTPSNERAVRKPSKESCQRRPAPAESGRILRDQDACEGISGTTYLLALCASLNSCNLGYDIGINNSAGPLVKKDLGLSDRQFECFSAIIPLFSALGCILTALISDKYGRRATFFASNLTLLIGVVFVSLAPSVELLLLGRALVGTGIGIGLSVDPVYIAEMSPPSHRGWLVTWSEVAISLGVLIGFLSGRTFQVAGHPHAWRGMFAVGGVTPMLMLVLVATVMLESPRWLLLMERDDEAKEVVKKLFGGEDESMHHGIVHEIKASLVAESKSYKAHSWMALLFPSGPLRTMMITGVVSGIAQQVVGIEPMIFYSQLIFAEAGETSAENVTSYAIGFGVAKTMAVCVAGKLFDTYGRKPLMMLSFMGMGICYFIFLVLFSMNSTPISLLVVSMGMWFMFFGLGAGPGCWLLTSELFSTTVRAKGVAITVVANRSVACLQLFTGLSVAGVVGLPPLFGMLGIASLLYVVFFSQVVPETRGQTLEEIADSFCALDGEKAPEDVEEDGKKTPEDSEAANQEPIRGG